MAIKARFQKSQISTWIFFLFFALTILLAGVSELFRIPSKENTEFQKYYAVYKKEDIEKITSLLVENKFGKFILEKNNSKETFTSWEITSPRNLPAQNRFVEDLVNSLQTLTIKNIHTIDPINLSNFSLDNPRLRIKYKINNSNWFELSFGLINPIDNSTYLHIAHKNIIYHIESPSFLSSLDVIEMPQVVDSDIFPFKKSDISSLEIEKYINSQKTSETLSFQKKKNIWLYKDGNALNFQEVEKFLEQLLLIKSQIMVDAKDENIDKILNKTLDPPLFKVTITITSGASFDYKISNLISKIPGLKIEKKQNFLIKSSLRKNPDIVSKNVLSIFQTTQKQLQGIPFKKLFY